MTDKLTQKDYELINSYLDQELSRKDVVKFAERMAEDPAISAEVADLMKVKAMVKELPTVNPPRNYILTRAMAEEARPKPFWERLFPVFRTAAAFCALALAFTFIFPLIQTNRATKTESAYVESAVYDMVEEIAEEAMPFRDEEIVLEDRSFGGGTDSYTAVMPSYGVRGGNPRIEYMMRQEENQISMKSVTFDPDNPPEGFISVEQAAANSRELILKTLLGAGLVFSVGGIILLNRKRKQLEVS